MECTITSAKSRMKSVKELMDLTDRVALVTGGGGHIGNAICEALAELGAGVVVLDRSAEACAETAENLRQTYSIDACGLVVDLSDEQETRAIPDRVVDQFGRLDILVNCAAFVGTSSLPGWATSFDRQTANAWRQAVELNLTAPFVLTQACAERLAASGKGSVINVSSIYGMVGPDVRMYEGTAMNTPAAYGASKGGLLQLTRWLATVMGPHTRVNSITPGGVFRNQDERFVTRYVEKTPLRRMAAEEDFKGAVAYLAGDLASYVTGHNLVVDGGWTAW